MTMATESEATSDGSVRVLRERQVPQPQQQGNMQLIAVLRAVAAVLSARFLLLLALAGAFVLALIALENPKTLTLTAAGIYDGLVFLPLVVLYFRKG